LTTVPPNRVAGASEVVGDPRRLQAVRDTNLLDTSPEETFDSLSRLAVTLTGVPASFLSLVDERRDFYKSQCGFPEPLASKRELSGRTFCHYALASAEPLVIEDTHANAVWRAVPTVDSLGVRAYLGVPVIVEGQAIGSFCVIDNRPHAWTSLEVETLVQIARAAAREIELRMVLKVARAEADRANALAKANQQLLAMVSHDLRSPLQVIRLSSAVLTGLVGENDRPHVDRIVRATDSMKILVDDLLPTFVPSSTSRRSAISTKKLLADAVDTMGMVAERAGISLSINCGTTGAVAVDYAQMLRVLGNLMANCVKYCPRGSSVVIQAEESESETRIVVRDDGPGMTAADSARAFERGWQGSEALTRKDGAGLGLAIVEELVRQNDGQVTLISRQGTGTTVTIHLPRAHT